MNIEAVPYGLNSHLSQVQFERNQQIFANCIALDFFKHVLHDLGNDFKTEDYDAPSYLEKEMWAIDLDITTRVGLAAVKSFSSKCEYLPPFTYWIEKTSKPGYLCVGADKKFLQDKMETIGILARQKLAKLFATYSNHPMRNDFRFHVMFDKEKHQLQVTFWLALESKL